MSGNKALLDTNVIIFASKKQLDIESLLLSYDEFYTSIISFMEVYDYEFSSIEEKELVDEVFENLEIIEINKKIAEQAIIYRKNKFKKIKLPDAIILATAKYLGAELVTDDWDDFLGIDNEVVIKKIDDYKT
ncbi:MAG: type II toxin-antitoxin system VapC family toxin [Bacteroidetes bacterium]|nr:MAG: type II toxin-antitoxin system VapC family toxin [Bacteroidota bacterium]